jgi:multisubunit Na+/H+ antiporter MnhC subunit
LAGAALEAGFFEITESVQVDPIPHALDLTSRAISLAFCGVLILGAFFLAIISDS